MARLNEETALPAVEKQYEDLAVDPLVGHDMASVERALILKTLAACEGNRTAAARILGLTPRTIRNKLRVWNGRQDAGHDAGQNAG